MTRRGTLAYYLAAWVVGCFVVSLMTAVFAQPGAENAPVDGPARLLILYFLALLYGAADILLFAFLLRHVMRLFSSHNLLIWMIVGAALGAAAVRILLSAGDVLVGMSPLTGRGLLSFFLLMFWTAPNALRLAGIWQAPVAGAAIAVVLCLVDRAFNREETEPQTDPTASGPRSAETTERAP
jgi:hypothetical protein